MNWSVGAGFNVMATVIAHVGGRVLRDQVRALLELPEPSTLHSSVQKISHSITKLG